MTNVQLRSLIRNISIRGAEFGLRWICLPISGVNGWHGDDIRQLAPALIKEEPSLFVHFLFNNYNSLLQESLSAIGDNILAISRISNNGFDNFRVGTGFNIVPDTPFFPFSWHEGDPAFSCAVESLTPLLNALAKKMDFEEELRSICGFVEEIAYEIADRQKDFSYRGQDISLAPYPNEGSSIALLMEKMGLDVFGLSGTTTLTSRLTRILKNAIGDSGARSCGFNGVMFSPLEDAGISKSMSEHNLTMDSFMLWSTLCGCGVDMMPVPGNTAAKTIGALYQDVATLSSRLSKPLGVRILPIPNGRVNQLTQFNHDFLVNTPIVDLSGGWSKL